MAQESFDQSGYYTRAIKAAVSIFTERDQTPEVAVDEQPIASSGRVALRPGIQIAASVSDLNTRRFLSPDATARAYTVPCRCGDLPEMREEITNFGLTAALEIRARNILPFYIDARPPAVLLIENIWTAPECARAHRALAARP